MSLFKSICVQQMRFLARPTRRALAAEAEGVSLKVTHVGHSCCCSSFYTLAFLSALGCTCKGEGFPFPAGSTSKIKMDWVVKLLVVSLCWKWGWFSKPGLVLGCTSFRWLGSGRAWGAVGMARALRLQYLHILTRIWGEFCSVSTLGSACPALG